MDKYDLKILELLQQNSRMSMAEIAGDVGLSEPACYRRVKETQSK